MLKLYSIISSSDQSLLLVSMRKSCTFEILVKSHYRIRIRFSHYLVRQLIHYLVRHLMRYWLNYKSWVAQSSKVTF